MRPTTRRKLEKTAKRAQKPRHGIEPSMRDFLQSVSFDKPVDPKKQAAFEAQDNADPDAF